MTAAYIPATVNEAQKRLHRSRRQIYRYLENGTLHIVGNILGSCILDSKEVFRLERLIGRLKKSGQLPNALKPLFPEYSLKSIDPIRHVTIILSRILERGRMEDVRWALKIYDPDDIKDFLSRNGQRLLSRKSLVFWCWYFNIPRPSSNRAISLAQKQGGVG